MIQETSMPWRAILSVLFFPIFFQESLIQFAWGATDPDWLMLLKRIYLLVPSAVFILGCWITSASLLSVLFRQNRREFITEVIVTWWDFGRSLFSFWGGVFRFLFHFVASIFILGRIFVFGLWGIVTDILFFPFRMLRNVGSNVLNPSVPWLAVFLTIVWCLMEGAIFTYVTSPLVVDTLSNLTGARLSVTFVRIPLFLFMLFIVLGSFAVLSTWKDAIQRKDIGAIVRISVIELVTIFVEVVFLYREFVDSLVPWFAQHSQNFELGIVGTLLIAGFAWVGIRGMTWFLFASHGAPTLMAIIQGTGLKTGGKSERVAVSSAFLQSSDFLKALKADSQWIHQKGDELLGSFILPPLQIIAAGINFCTLLVTSQHLFELPFKSLKDVMETKVTPRKINKERA